jgi:hypothetical protein
MRRWAVMFVVAGCSGGGGSMSTSPASLTLSLHVGDDEQDVQAMSVATESLASAYGSALKSLKYYIQSIDICESADGGGAYRNCLELYRGPSEPYFDGELMSGSRDFVGDGDYARTHDLVGFIDLMDPASRAQLAKPVTLQPENAHVYNWGFINWAHPIKLTAELTPSGASAPTMFTHDGTTAHRADPNDASAYTTTASMPLTISPATEAVVVLDNGGSYFHFQAPFTILPEDVTNKAQFFLDLTFEPDGIIRGYTAPGPAIDVLVDDGGHGINVPYLDLSPVPHKKCERTVKEVYVGTATADANNSFDLRLEIYYLQSDPKKQIYGVEMAALANAASGQGYALAKPASITTNPDGSLDFIDEQGHGYITGLIRRSHVGDSTAVVLDCTGQFSNPFPGSCTTSVPVILTLQKVAALGSTSGCTCTTSSDCPGTGQVCVVGACVACGQPGSDGKSCSSGGGSCCGGKCVDSSTDGANCGGCGTVCANGSTCAGGSCTCGASIATCVAGTAKCSACGATRMCQGGACACVTRDDCWDPRQVCENGACILCGANQTVNAACKGGGACCKASGKCVNLGADPSNCGTCGNVCVSNYCYAAAGGGSACAPVCPSQFMLDCDHNPANGCESDVTLDNNNCGSCGHVCPTNTYCTPLKYQTFGGQLVTYGAQCK